MFTNYLKIAIRNLLRNKVFSFINLAGLAIGITCCLLITLNILDELSYDRYHQKSQQIYRVVRDKSARTSFPLAATLTNNFPEIIEAVRITNTWDRMVCNDDKKFNEEKFIYADSNLFEVFSFPLLRGNPKTVLSEPFSIVITEELAHKYFGNDDPMGKILIVENEFSYTITGVMKQIPRHSHFRVDLIATLVGSEKMFWEGFFDNWGAWNAYTYLLLPPNCPVHELETKYSDEIVKVISVQAPQLGEIRHYLQPLTAIHLYSADMKDNIEPQGDITFIFIFSGIAVFILFIACINFMNLSTARATTRAREVGVRKAIGASRTQLIRQFLGETTLFALVALLIALGLVMIFLPTLNSITNKELAPVDLVNWKMALALPGIVLFISFIAGCYPAFFLSAFQSAKTLKGRSAAGLKNASLKRILVVIQFTVSITLIIGSSIIFGQLNYIKNKKLGFDKEHIIVMEMPEPGAVKNDMFKEKLLQHSSITSVSSADRIPPNRLGWWTTFRLKDSDKDVWLPIVCVNYDYFEMLGIEIVAGRSFSNIFSSDPSAALILNESAVKELGLETPLGTHIETAYNRPDCRVVGVVKDFHFESLYEKIKPMAFVLDPPSCWQFIARIQTGDIPGTLDLIKAEWKSIYPDWVFKYHFLDDNYNNLYRAQEKIGSLIGYFSFFAIFIACLGLFGLLALVIQQQYREIGVRKVLGASFLDITVLLSKDFVKWIVLANIIAWPIAWYAMHKWLQNFAYRISMQWWMFILTGIIVIIIALFTIGWQVVRAARANPIEALRYE